MQQHYSTVAGEEVRAGLAKVIYLGGFTKAQHGKSGDPGGDEAAHPKRAAPRWRRKVPDFGRLVGAGEGT
jgi:isocitrate lyase